MHMLVAMHACIQDAWHWCQHVCLWGCRALGEVVVCACMFVFCAKLVHILLWEVWCLMDFWVGAQGCKTHMSKYNYGGACMWSHAELVGAHVACLCVHASGMDFSVHVLLTNVLCPCVHMHAPHGRPPSSPLTMTLTSWTQMLRRRQARLGLLQHVEMPRLGLSPRRAGG